MHIGAVTGWGLVAAASKSVLLLHEISFALLDTSIYIAKIDTSQPSSLK
jgi:hypothetical protein